jgi:2-keto-4-pentenoate hydratase
MGIAPLALLRHTLPAGFAEQIRTVPEDAMDHSTPKSLADKLVAARKDRTRLPLDTPPPASFADAYETQRLVTEALGHDVKAWKIGLAPDGTVFAAPMYTTKDRVLHAAPTGFVAAEVEYAIRLAKDLPQREISRAEALELVDEVMLGFEFVETRFIEVPSLLLHTADNVANGGYATGPILPRSELDLPQRRIVIKADGHTLFDGPATHPNGDVLGPLMAYAKASADPAKRDQLGGIRAGHLVTLGSLCGGVPVPHACDLVAEMPGVGRFDLRFER